MRADLILKNAAQILTCRGPAPRSGEAQRDASPIANATVASFEGSIVFVGASRDADAAVTPTPHATVIDAGGGTVLPGFVDAHTHVVFAGDRREELRRRLAGATYQEIAASGGGIVSTVRDTRQAKDDDLARQTRVRLDEMLRCGTTTCEAKSGYGLTVDSELKQLRVIRRLDREQPIDLVPTFLGAHEVPLEYRNRRDQYVDLVVNEMIPAVARERLAEWCDVFCETGAFTPEESIRILRAGQAAGLKSRLHADELGLSGGSAVAVHVGARSADHLVFVDRDHAEAMARAQIVATLLPAAAFFLKLGRFAPARMLVGTGVPVAIATDVNPGGGFSPSMPFAIALACFAMDMTLDEALVAATLNAAFALDRHDRIGSLEAGKQMDAVVLDGGPVELLRVGAPAIRMVIKSGKVAWSSG
ncbi:MAG: imidazolonepropionase [Acidobacteria bacterium]|nr:imidazolonepropionase [Acidobacteriota bacterium]MBI3261961.1 imidazolonepropionase [Acidobacteriota bacterium]